VRQKRRSYREPPDDDEDAISDNLAAVNERLDDLTRQLDRIARQNAEPRTGSNAARPTDRVAEALARLDRRLDQIVEQDDEEPAPAPGRSRGSSPRPRPASPPPAARAAGPASWAAQISARQRALDGDTDESAQTPPAPRSAPRAAPQTAWAQAPDLTGVEQQLRQITTQIATLHQPYEDGLTALRNDLAEIGRVLTEALPKRAIEDLEAQVRALAERIDRSRQAGADAEALAGVEQGLAEVRDALRALTPAENLVGFEEAVRGLAHKIDQIAASAQTPQDPLAFKQLEQAVVSLRSVVANVASDGALAQLSAEVHGLASRFERAAAESSSEALGRLEERISSLMESGRAIPPELEGSIRSLSERLDRLNLSKGDQLALEALEDRIAKLSEKLDASDARLNNLAAIERGMAELLVHLEAMRNGGAQQPAPVASETKAEIPQAGAAQPQPEQPAFQLQAPVYEPEPTPATPSPVAYAPQPPRVVVPQQHPRPAPRAYRQEPIDPNLPPDTPLEPGGGAPRHRPGSAAARIAASEAALGQTRAPSADSGGKSAAIAAARSAAKSAYFEEPAKGSKSKERRGWFKRRRETEPDLPTIRIPEPNADADEALTPRKRAMKHFKTILITISVAIIVIGTVQTALELLLPSQPSSPPAVESSHERTQPPQSRPATGRQMPAPGGPVAPAPATPSPAAPADRTSSILQPTPMASSQAPLVDITGSIPPQPAPAQSATPRAPAPAAVPDVSASPSGQPDTLALPASVGPALRSAVLANDPAAFYEMGARFAEGRGVKASQTEAVRWLERAANAGFAPAQFRLAGLNEKGDGVKKDVQAARRLYQAAAGKGHAKAMHNLAVLHAEGVDGRPDYKAAAQWFRKAASYGIADSQYNLAILYARGIGVETNLAESYKWFSLAAAKGDADAAKKRDEVGSRLSQQALNAARLAAQTFTPEREPEAATDLRVPPGGWDRSPVPQVRANRRTPAPAAR
jgi:localization factor PodJL